MNWVRIYLLIYSLAVAVNAFSQGDSLQLYLDSAQAYQSERDFEQASKILKLTIERHLPLSDNDSLNAQVYHQLGIIYYRMRNGREAIEAWNQAITLRHKFLPANHIDIIKTHINNANANLMLNEYELASASLIHALDLLNTQPERDLHNLSRVYESLGLVARLTEDFQLAKDYLMQSYLIKEEIYPAEKWRLIDISTRLFDIYKDLDDKNKMLEFALLDLEYSRAAPADNDKYYFDLANAYNNLGIAHSANYDARDAIEHFSRSIEINSQFPDREESLAFTYNNLILQYNILGEYKHALKFGDLARSFFSRDSSYAIYLAETLIEEGDVYFALKDYGKAAEKYHQSVGCKVIERKLIYPSDNPSTNDLILGTRTSLMDALYKKAKCLFKLGQVNESTLASESLFGFVRQIRNQLSDRTSKKYLSQSTKKFYELSIDLQYAQYESSGQLKYLEKAVSLFDESKSRLLYDALYQNALTSVDKNLKSLLEKERTYYRAIAHKEEIIWESKSEVTEINERDSILYYRMKITGLRDSILDLMSIDLHEHRGEQLYNVEVLQNHFIPEKSVMVQYFVGIDNVYAIYISPSQYHFKLIGSTAHLSQKVNHFLQNLKDPNSSIKDYLTNSFELYAHTIKDFLEADIIEKLIIIPDDILSYIPFEALSVHPVSGDSYRSIDYLINKYTVSYAASLSVLDLQNKRSSKTRKKAFLGMASDYAEQESAGLERLTFAVEELIEINEMARGDIFLNEQATKDKFLDIQSHYRNIHLSLHGFVNSENSSFSYLQFPAMLVEKSDDGKLYTLEIYNRSFNTEMLVLSACETGSGTLARGEGILSLAHAFASAGTKSTVLSLWQLSSRSTAEIMKNFYSRLELSYPQDQALQMAKLDYFEKTKATELTHPFYWASMIHYGTPSTVNFQRSLSVWTYVIVTILISCFGYWIFLRRSVASSK